MGIPAWAAVLGAPYAVDKVIVDPIKSIMGTVNDFRDEHQMQSDLERFKADPTYTVDITNYHDPAKGVNTSNLLKSQRDTYYQQQAAPISKMLAEFKATGNDADPNFSGAEWLKGMATMYPVDGKTMTEEEYNAALSGAIPSAQKGSIPLSKFGANPVTADLLQKAQVEAQQKGSLARAFGPNPSPLDLATIAMNKDVAGGFENATEGQRRMFENKKQATELQTKTADATNAAEYQRAIAGVGGAYRDAAPYDPSKPRAANADPRTGLVYTSENYVMPYDQAKNLVLQAASDYGQDPTKSLEELKKQYEGTYLDANGQPTDLNWMGKEATRTKEQLYSAAQRGDTKAKAILAQMQKDEIAQANAKRQVIVNNPVPPRMSMNMNELGDAEKNALSTAIAEKRLDPYRVNSKNQQLLAAAALQNPGINLNDIAATLGVARNKDVVMKAGIAEMVPGLLQNVVTAGKKLDYSDVQFKGKVQQYVKGQLNDPALVEYMTARNDLLLTLGGVMRGNGMTDMAQKLEEQAAHPTMSPKALDGWLKGQMASVDPRIKLYRSLIAGKGIPPQPGGQGGGTWEAYKKQRGM